ncbi:MAG: hypothetical protein P8Y77_05640 [Nitrospirota bacterium]|jgi:hypothetical protein
MECIAEAAEKKAWEPQVGSVGKPGSKSGIVVFTRRQCGMALGAVLVIISLTLLMPASSFAHGFAGKRFFPTTFVVEDPFVSDEFSILFSHIKEPGEEDEPAVKASEFSFEYSKRITPRLGMSLEEEYRILDFEGAETERGFGNLELGLKYQALTSEEHEALISFGVGVELGDTGARKAEANSFSTISPAVFFGKGFGDLPESVKFLRPLAVTGVIGPNFPAKSKTVVDGEEKLNPITLSWGFTVQYNLQYLQSFVKDVGLGDPLKRMVVIVEFPMETCLNQDCEGQTTGTVNPGIIWFGKQFQLGIAAQIPINSRTGHNVGVLGLVHLFIDDMFPNSIGKPIFP